tara:strand:+ start:1073 stop:1594 length:522 start_codon:yes stop_codon:yes gene_type:complete
MSILEAIKEEFNYLRGNYGLGTAIAYLLVPTIALQTEQEGLSTENLLKELDVSPRDILLKQQEILFKVKTSNVAQFINTLEFLVGLDMDAQFLPETTKEQIRGELAKLNPQASWRSLYPSLQVLAMRDGILGSNGLSDSTALLGAYLNKNKPLPLGFIFGGVTLALLAYTALR